MKLIKQFLLLSLFFVPCISGAQVATTAGSNLTAWNGNSGATNNNNWNTLMNNRTLAGGAGAPTADFGNCNSLIMRCAQPKCAACTTLEIAKPIVEGCVNSNKDCKKHGNDLVDFIAAQIVANANAKIQEQQLMAQQAAASAAAAQSNQQMQQMQMQMQQMQQQMQAQNAQQMASMQAALEEQKALVAQAQQEAAAAQQAKIDAQTAPGVTVAQQVAIDSGVSEDVLVRQQISGQILSAVENAEVQLKTLKATMQNAFEYAGCDARGNNCTGPKRVKMFKEKAGEFFEPYNTVLDSLYDALIIAQSVGVDITEIYLMLSNSCNSWGEYLCSDTTRYLYNSTNCPNGRSVASETSKGNHTCTIGHVVPAEDSPACTLQKVLADQAEVQRGLLDPAQSTDAMIRIGCASSALESTGLFANRKKQASIDIDTLQRILEQDAPSTCMSQAFSGNKTNKDCEDMNFVKYCHVGDGSYPELQKYAATKSLPKKVCIKGDQLETYAKKGGALLFETSNNSGSSVAIRCEHDANKKQCICKSAMYADAEWDSSATQCKCADKDMTFSYVVAQCVKKDLLTSTEQSVKDGCTGSGGTWDNNLLYCRCNGITHVNVGSKCEKLENSVICRNSGGTWDGATCDCEGDQFESYMTDYGACVKK